MFPSRGNQIKSSTMNDTVTSQISQKTLPVLAITLAIAFGLATMVMADTPMGISESANLYDLKSFPEVYRSVDWKTAWKSGDVRAGAKLFQLRCVACHSIDGAQTREELSGDALSVGPSLAGVAHRLAPEYMAQSIVVPSQNIAKEYQPWSALTLDGQVIVGHRIERKNQDANAITLQMMNGQLVTVEQEEIEDLVPSLLSVMPVGLTAGPDEVKHLTAYLMMLSSKPDRIAELKVLRQQWAVQDAAQRERLIAEGSFAVPEFDTGRPQPVTQGSLSLGSGLAMSRGYFRGVPLGEMGGWTISIWFQPQSDTKGDIFGLVLDPASGKAVRVTCEDGKLSVNGPGRNPKDKGWAVDAGEVEPEKWHHLVITRAQGIGMNVYLNGEHVAEQAQDRLGYGQSFNVYHFGAAVLGIDKDSDGQSNEILGDFFDGLIDDFTAYERPLTEGEISRLHGGESITDAMVAFNDFENVSHRDLARFLKSDNSDAYLEEGRQLYELNCIQCHSIDGIQPSKNPLARAFTQHKMENGGDPYSMFRTITYGFRNMMAATQLSPEERYKVIHYLREKMIRPQSPDLYVNIPEDYTNTMPNSPRGSGEAAAQIEALAKVGYLRDYGRALIAPVQGTRENGIRSVNALVIDLGNETSMGYDLGTMRSLGAWTGGFLDFSNTLHHKLRAAGLPQARFDSLPGNDDWQWAWDGDAETSPPDLTPLTVWPAEQVTYRGHYPHGEDIVVSYDVQGRGVLESPSAIVASDTTAIVRRMTISPGNNALNLVVSVDENTEVTIDGDRATVRTKSDQFVLAIQTDSRQEVLWPEWQILSSGRLVLHVPSSPAHLNFNLVNSTKPLDHSHEIIDLTQRTTGGTRRWKETHTMKGKLAGDEFQGYVMDSIPVPLKNAYNSWMRTASLAFFPDGRLAVATLGGDVWIVSGIDNDLQAVKWQRFAAGLYEPLGMKVVDNVLTVGTRGRIVKLHDYNDDGEADFYEAFFNEPEPDPGWHAYSFDLEVGDDGSYYYARVGGFSDWSVPGGIVRVAPDGKSWEVVGAGMRVPNGIGRLPDGRITFGDNQGTYVPASKIAITHRGAFHGAGKWPNRDGDYDPKDIVEPIVYMPQELDSSSGSQLWVEHDERFGPLSGQYFHTSYGRARTMVVMLDEVENTTQGAVFSIPLTMESGTMRVAKNPADGQLYFSGLTGWQAGATREGSIQRMRFTRDEGLYVQSAKARQGRLELTFNQPLDPDSLDDIEGWSAEAWNYRWSDRYGSPHLKVSDPNQQGTDIWGIEGIEFANDGHTVIVSLPELEPCHTLKLEFELEGENSTSLSGPIYFTIHELPE